MTSWIKIVNDTRYHSVYSIHTTGGAFVAGGSVRPNQSDTRRGLIATVYHVKVSQQGQTAGTVITLHPHSGETLRISHLFGNFLSFSGPTAESTLCAEELSQYLADGGKKDDSLVEVISHLIKKGSITSTIEEAKE